MRHMDANGTYRKKAWQQLHKNAASNTPQNSSCMATYQPSRKLSKLDEPHMQDIAEEVRTNS